MSVLRKTNFGKKNSIQVLISKTLIEGVAGVTTKSSLASKLNVLEADIINFDISGDSINCEVTNSYVPDINFPTVAYKDIDGQCTGIQPQAYLRSPIKIFYSPSAANFSNRPFFGCKSLQYCIIPGIQVYDNAPYSQHMFEVDTSGGQANLNQLTVCFPAAWETSNNGAMHPEAQYVVDNGGTVTFGDIENYNFLLAEPPKPTGLVVNNVAGRAAYISFNEVNHSNTIIRYEVFIDGVFSKNIKPVNGAIIFENLSTSYTVTVQAVDEYYNRSQFSDPVIINTEATEPLPYLASAYKLQEVDGNNGLIPAFNNLVGQIFGSPLFGQPGVIGNSIYLGADTALKIPNPGIWKKVSLCFWVKKDSAFVSSSGGIGSTQNGPLAQGYYGNSNGNNYSSFFKTSRQTVGGDQVAKTNFHLFTIVANQITNRWESYQNTTLVSSGSPGNFQAKLRDDFFFIGKNIGNETGDIPNGENFMGNVEQVLIFWKDIDLAQIQSIYNNGNGINI